MVGAAAAWRASGGPGYRWGAVVAALLGAMFIQVGTNLANDVFDFEKGADTAERLGPTRVTQAGLLSPSQVRGGMVASFALATAAGVYLTAVAGWPIVAIGVASIASGVAYTGGPSSATTAWATSSSSSSSRPRRRRRNRLRRARPRPRAGPGARGPVGALATAVLVVNNVRDHVTDVRAGKRTLVVRFGRRFGVAEYLACWAAALAVPVALAASRRSPWMLLPLITLPMAVALSRKVATLEGRPLNPVLGATAGALLLHSLLTVAGLLQG